MLKEISRKISLSVDEALKLKLEPAELAKQGWVLRDKNWEKRIMVPAIFETEHNDGGVPDVGNPTESDIFDAVEKILNSGLMKPEELARVLNNGMYLAVNAKSKPKGQATPTGLRTVFFANATAEEALAMVKAGASQVGGDMDYIKTWHAKRNNA